MSVRNYHTMPVVKYLSLELFDAAATGRTEECRGFLERNADVNAAYDKSKETALMRAAKMAYIDTCRFLLGEKADVNARGQDRQTALTYAAGKGNIQLCRLLLDEKADVDARSMALMYATMANHTEICRLLLDGKANVVNAVDTGQGSHVTALKYGYGRSLTGDTFLHRSTRAERN